MDSLLSQQEIYFSPLAGSFDVEAARAQVEALGFAWRHPGVPSIFLIFHDAESRANCDSAVSADPLARLPYVLLIDVKDDLIHVNLFAGPEYAETARPFLSWLHQKYQCSAWNEEGTELSEDLPIC
jgi:hypothetical protein